LARSRSVRPDEALRGRPKTIESGDSTAAVMPSLQPGIQSDYPADAGLVYTGQARAIWPRLSEDLLRMRSENFAYETENFACELEKFACEMFRFARPSLTH